MFLYIGNVIIPNDFHIFQWGWGQPPNKSPAFSAQGFRGQTHQVRFFSAEESNFNGRPGDPVISVGDFSMKSRKKCHMNLHYC